MSSHFGSDLQIPISDLVTRCNQHDVSRLPAQSILSLDQLHYFLSYKTAWNDERHILFLLFYIFYIHAWVLAIILLFIYVWSKKTYMNKNLFFSFFHFCSFSFFSSLLMDLHNFYVYNFNDYWYCKWERMHFTLTTVFVSTPINTEIILMSLYRSIEIRTHRNYTGFKRSF